MGKQETIERITAALTRLSESELERIERLLARTGPVPRKANQAPHLLGDTEAFEKTEFLAWDEAYNAVVDRLSQIITAQSGTFEPRWAIVDAGCDDQTDESYVTFRWQVYTLPERDSERPDEHLHQVILCGTNNPRDSREDIDRDFLQDTDRGRTQPHHFR